MKQLTIFLFIFIFFTTNNVFANTTNTPKVDAQGAVLIDQKTGRVFLVKMKMSHYLWLAQQK